MSFASPQLLLLLIPALAITAYIGWPRQRFRRRRDISALLIRSILLTLLILALAGVQLVRTVDRLAVVFLVDASDSMGADLAQAQVEYIRAAVAEKPTDDEWAVIVFGADVSIDKPFSALTEVNALRSEVLGSNTDLAQGIQTAISLFPADARRRIVILSDGQQTIGDAEAKARLAQASGVEISYVPLFREPLPDVRIAELTSPARVSEGQEFDITVTIESELETDATLLLFSAGALVHEQGVSLREGSISYSITRRSDESGFIDFSAQIIVPGGNDDFVQNNQLGSFSEIVGPARALLVSTQADDVVHLIPALEATGLLLDVVTPAQLPADIAGLAPYESVIVVNVPATQFTQRQMVRLNSYVQDLGGGFVFVGGPQSYGPGGYFQTPIEELLPLETQIRDQQRIPQLTIAYLVDSSGSMGADLQGGFSNLQLAQRAINISLDFLQPSDRAAVGTFDSSGSWVANFQDVADKRLLQSLVNTLRAGGGTDILSGLRLVERDILQEPSERKHIILLTDGGSNPDGLVELTQRLQDDFDVTTSIVAVSMNPPDFLQEMAQAGNGRFHQVMNASSIPNIFALETVLATRSYIEEGDFALVQSANSPILDGISSLPPLRGYVATAGKNTAQVILRGPEPFSDPILASWQYGLGRAVAFTSDATSRWSSEWVTWDGFSRFWGQVVESSITESAGNNIESRVVMEDGRARIIIDARDDEGQFLNNLALQTSVVSPQSSQSSTLRLQQTAPGRYEGFFTPQEEGSYFLGINGGGTLPDGQPLTFNEVTGWVMSYSPEYARRQPNERLLADIADITGGADVEANPADSFAVTQEPRTAVAPVWPILLVLALLLLPVDIAVRRIIITRSDLRRLREWVFGNPESESDRQRMSSLMQARQRARQRTGQGEADEGTIAALRRARDEGDDPSAPDRPPQGATPPQPRRPRSTPQPPPRATGGDSTVSNLLKRRRDREDD